MPNRHDPLSLPAWHGLHREVRLVSQLIGAGATALSEASYASGMGNYYTAFFSLSVGIERLAKLVIVADHVLCNQGQLPPQSVVRGFGHDLNRLSDEVHQISEAHKLALRYPRPDDPITGAVLGCLSAFADASRGRYANFERIGNPNYDSSEEPVAKWWREVVEPSLDKHYRGKAAEVGVKHRARMIDTLIGGESRVHFFDESGRTMSDFATASERTGQTKYAQKYGRFYTLVIARWMMDAFSELTIHTGYKSNFEVLWGHHEEFGSYLNENDFLLTRKRWPLR